MGTRGAYGFRVNGTDKVMYNQFDTYPSGLGTIMCLFVIDTPISILRSIAHDIVLVSNGAKPTLEQISLCEDFADSHVSEQLYEDWYCLLRNAQNNPYVYRDTGLIYMLDAGSFLDDSLFCEWAYIINMDTEQLEFYTGFNKDRDAPGRYAAGKRKTDDEYWGVRLVLSVPLMDFRRKAYRKIAENLNQEAYYKFAYGKNCQESFFEMLSNVMEERPRRPTVHKTTVKDTIKEERKRRKLCLGPNRITAKTERGKA